jgi:predicted amidohydrolase YtcJ
MRTDHPVGLAENALILNIDPVHVQSISGILDQIRISAQSIPAGQWIRAGRYNEFYLDEKRHPTRSDLDKATSCHPVKLSHRSGHVHVLNSLALELAGITIETPDPPGGLIDRDIETGEPNGILYNMGHWLASIIPQVSEEEWTRAMRKAANIVVGMNTACRMHLNGTILTGGMHIDDGKRYGHLNRE